MPKLVWKRPVSREAGRPFLLDPFRGLFFWGWVSFFWGLGPFFSHFRFRRFRGIPQTFALAIFCAASFRLLIRNAHRLTLRQNLSSASDQFRIDTSAHHIGYEGGNVAHASIASRVLRAPSWARRQARNWRDLTAGDCTGSSELGMRSMRETSGLATGTFLGG